MIRLPGVPFDGSIYGAGGGSMTGGPSKIVLHSTEGSWDGSMSVFRSRLTAPHVLADPVRRRIVQLVSLDRSGYSLRNESGGVQTNTDGVLQVEIVMLAANARALTHDELDWLGTDVVRPLADHAISPIDLTQTVPFIPYPASYGESDVRMSQADWDAFNGVCGHMHVPENDHGDPGAIDIDRILTAARGDDLTMADIEKLVDATNRQTEVIINQGRKTRNTIARQGVLARQQAARLAGDDDAAKAADAQLEELAAEEDELAKQAG